MFGFEEEPDGKMLGPVETEVREWTLGSSFGR